MSPPEASSHDHHQPPPAMNAETMSPDQHCAAALSALRAYLGMGFLKHDHQAFAFRNLVWKFIHTAAHSNLASGVDESAWRIEDLVDAFMHTYETRLWPADAAGEETKAHLNQYIRWQGGGGVCMSYEVEGRLLREGEDGMMWGDGREGSWLWGVLVRFFEYVKGEWSPGTRLGVEELVRCVLAGREYVGEGMTMEGVAGVEAGRLSVLGSAELRESETEQEGEAAMDGQCDALSVDP
ncbi:hypothetical protein LTR53_011453 [Teratosphaeriaceae sp. CCFEE 6253]|nr:hypothetical protein LTR53_011453 [Teratosphaeriaceae sp. CCFEE 6253]